MLELCQQITSGIVNIVFAVAGVVMLKIVAPWLQNVGIPWLKEKHLYSIVKKFVMAAEKMAEAGTIDKSAKLDYVLNMLRAKGVNITSEVRAFIESAVEELDIASDAYFMFADGILDLLFGDDDDDVDDAEDDDANDDDAEDDAENEAEPHDDAEGDA